MASDFYDFSCELELRQQHNRSLVTLKIEAEYMDGRELGNLQELRIMFPDGHSIVVCPVLPKPVFNLSLENRRGVKLCKSDRLIYQEVWRRLRSGEIKLQYQGGWCPSGTTWGPED